MHLGGRRSFIPAIKGAITCVVATLEEIAHGCVLALLVRSRFNLPITSVVGSKRKVAVSGARTRSEMLLGNGR